MTTKGKGGQKYPKIWLRGLCSCNNGRWHFCQITSILQIESSSSIETQSYEKINQDTFSFTPVNLTRGLFLKMKRKIGNFTIFLHEYMKDLLGLTLHRQKGYILIKKIKAHLIYFNASSVLGIYCKISKYPITLLLYCMSPYMVRTSAGWSFYKFPFMDRLYHNCSDFYRKYIFTLCYFFFFPY